MEEAGDSRKNELSKSFKLAVQVCLSAVCLFCFISNLHHLFKYTFVYVVYLKEFCKSFPSFTQAEQERLYSLYIQVIISLHENIEICYHKRILASFQCYNFVDEFADLCQEVKVGNVLDTVEELVDKQTLDPLYPDKTNFKDVARELVTSKKNEIQTLQNMLEKKEAQNKVLRSRVELLQKQIQDPSGASNALEKAVDQAGLSQRLKVKDMINNEQWSWPENWNLEFPILSTIHTPTLCANSSDKFMWSTNDGSCVNYSTNRAWKDLRQHGEKVKGVNNPKTQMQTELIALKFDQVSKFKKCDQSSTNNANDQVFNCSFRFEVSPSSGNHTIFLSTIVQGGSNRYDFISQMSDDVLLMILCLLPTKDVIATSILSTRWRFSGYDSSSRLMLDIEAGGNRWRSPSSLRNLSLSFVKLNNEMLQEFLTSSPHLETLSIYPVQNDLNNFCIGGRALNLKHLKLKSIMGFESVDLYDFDLVSFTSEGSVRELRLTDLPMLKELNIKNNRLLHNNLFSEMSSCLPNLQVLSICAGLALVLSSSDHHRTIIKSSRPCPHHTHTSLASLPLSTIMVVGFLMNRSLQARACPILETFTIEQQWYSQFTRRKVRHAASHPHTHLKIFQFMGYYGRNNDLELVLYVINNAIGLKRILIDPRDQNPNNYAYTGYRDASKIEEAGRSSAKRKLKSMSPPGVELVIL
ncbi:Nnf1 [Artemisia annua]|uniref:Nnf1 n=1 Tax=Artemisia annua TaxID=35608 RepID=A0A2U1PUQ1_ARTAN|nr:Nnf1 [Artemisia annua]